MIHQFIMIFYAFISLIAVIVYMLKKNTQQESQQWRKHVSMLLFALAHLFFLYLALAGMFADVAIIWLISAAVMVVCTRMLNGLLLFGKIHPVHHIIIAGLMVLIIVLDSAGV